MKIKNVFLILIFSYFILLSPSKSYENKILFKVNNEIITSIDILEEIEYLKMINDNLENLKKIADIIDISGGVETNGLKDISKIETFLNNIKNLNNET